MNNQRHKVWIDRFQTYLSIRIALYFILYQVSVGILFFVGHLMLSHAVEMTGREESTLLFVLVVIPIGVLGAMFIYDAIAYTHRIVGPIYRFRKAIQAIIDNDEMELVRLRKDDYLKDLRDEFNEMLTVLEKRGAVRLKSAEPAEPVEAVTSSLG